MRLGRQGAAAAKFVRGPGDDSGYGAVEPAGAPEPATGVLVAVGGLALFGRRRNA